MTPQPLRFGPFVLDNARALLTREGRTIEVGPKGLTLLRALLREPGQVVSKSVLMDAAWPGSIVEESNLSVQIAALRKLLGPQADGRSWIATVHRIGYRFAGDVRGMVPGAKVASDPIERSSILVLPLANISGEPEQDYLADGITEDIITALARFRWFRVIGRHSSFAFKGREVDSKFLTRELGVRYIFEGSLRRSGQHIRISAQLVDAPSANQIWSERFETELTEAFALQDAIAERVAGAIEPELLRVESLPAAVRHSGNVTAWDIVRQGTWNFHQVSRAGHLRARELFREAATLDPELAEAHSWLGRVSAGIVAYGWTERPATDIREGLDGALRAIQLDEKNPYSHYALAICSAYANAPEQSVLAAERAIELSPSFALGHLVLGMGHLFRGDARRAIPAFERGLTLNAFDPQNFVWYNILALTHLFAGEPDEALAAAIKARKVRPSWRPIYETLLCCHVTLGQSEEAAQCRTAMRELESPAGDALAPLRARNPEWAAHLADLLAKGACTG